MSERKKVGLLTRKTSTKTELYATESVGSVVGLNGAEAVTPCNIAVATV